MCPWAVSPPRSLVSALCGRLRAQLPAGLRAARLQTALRPGACLAAPLHRTLPRPPLCRTPSRAKAAPPGPCRPRPPSAARARLGAALPQHLRPCVPTLAGLSTTRTAAATPSVSPPSCARPRCTTWGGAWRMRLHPRAGEQCVSAGRRLAWECMPSRFSSSSSVRLLRLLSYAFCWWDACACVCVPVCVRLRKATWHPRSDTL